MNTTDDAVSQQQPTSATPEDNRPNWVRGIVLSAAVAGALLFIFFPKGMLSAAQHFVGTRHKAVWKHRRHCLSDSEVVAADTGKLIAANVLECLKKASK